VLLGKFTALDPVDVLGHGRGVSNRRICGRERETTTARCIRRARLGLRDGFRTWTGRSGTGGGDTAGRTLLVFNHDARSASAHDGAKGSGCGNAAYSTIGAAVAAASPGDTIKVCPCTYPEDVAVDKALTLTGQNATIDATGKDNGVQVLASGVTVQGFTVMNAIGEGILVGQTPLPQGVTPLDIGDVTIQDNIVVDNDQGNPTGQELTASSYAQCVAANNIPGDCGEGIHLLSVHSSTVTGNYVSGDSGGILLTDENGATYGNTISSNTVSNNLYDCGITIAGHRPLVFGGGVHDNTISGNRATGNGVLGQGGGVLLASGVPGNIPGIPGRAAPSTTTRPPGTSSPVTVWPG